MAQFTLTLKQVVEREGRNNIGLDTYPIFNEAYRDQLNNKIIDHFWNREIGQETISMFRFALRRKMNEIMPLYNQHYQLSLIEIDPLQTMDIHSLTKGQADSTSKGETSTASKGDSSSRAVSSETPQVRLAGDGDYASSAQDSTASNTSSGTGNDSRNDSTTQSGDTRTSGSQGHSALLILQARQALVNVDMLVISELEGQFMLVWANGDNYTENGYLSNGYYF